MLTPMIQVNEDVIAFANRLADAAGEVIRPYFRVPIDVTDKGTGRAGYDPVTAADQQAEIAMRRLINAEHPTHSIIGEEAGAEMKEGASDKTAWVLDPIDGTRAFICGQMQWGTLIALNDGTRPILGVLDQPITRERWLGHGRHASLTTPDGKKTIHVRPCVRLADAILMSTHPSAYFDEVERRMFERVLPHAKMTRFGGDCYMYGLLAMGFVDLIIEAQLKAWDVQALIPIVEGAGGVFTSWDGGDPQQGGRVIAAGDARVHREAMALLNAPS